MRCLTNTLTLLLLTTGCAVAHRPQRDRLASVQWPTANTCPAAPTTAAEGAEKEAVACAEAFIRRNGYTDAAPVHDSTQLAAESYPLPLGLAELLEMRRGSLEPRAYGVCRSTGWHAYTVVFRLASSGEDLDPRSEARRQTTGRAVTMDGSYQHVVMQHREFSIAAIDQPHQGCRRLARR